MLPEPSKWADISVLVTGGASFIGSHLVDKLVQLGAKVTVIDNLSSGKLENLAHSISKIKFIKADLEYITKQEIIDMFKGHERVFHLAAVHGGRGFIATHPADVSSNLSIDHHVFEACTDAGVEKVVFASTACVYPTKLQKKIGSDYKLKEVDSNPFDLDGFMSADIEYGWGKLMSEIQMISFKKQYGLKGCPVRFVTAYGPRENETHAIIALIYKAVEKMDPYEIWGDGQQERDFTYVEDIVEGTILASERISDCTPINLGTGRRYKIIEVVEMICKILNWRPSRFKFDTSKPVGALSRALDNSRAYEMIEWKPRFTLEEGLQKTIDWYVKTHKKEGNVSSKLLLEHKT
ncbi:NAD-dependent epimerase/dehydratase [Candidatus Nitrososphaera gargensis Ga9.2]|uniref:NAD-dependent epimerase/dehydratase n=1 Tax=Nitrososphaera gargensis (strain Ga9.2) TaxID=1237085 RepID=K0IMG5_NITGG|nr:NAD-dependent epimerase/dehydratase family protein [Candidatus Nitrososphaera gargensis]AFU57879.1 NAD-dependent epimerase/dehydratase [Candidatus Nitrososphaera gargensis Ga9.2]